MYIENKDWKKNRAEIAKLELSRLLVVAKTDMGVN